MGSFGIRPVSQGCIGLNVKSNIVYKFFPKGEFEFYRPFHFAYIVPSEFSKMDFRFCIGRDFWVGE